MGAFIVRRLIQTVIVLVIVSFIAFSILHLLPGDPVLTMLGMEATPAQVEALRHELGLDRPFLVQYAHWFTNVLQGDFGRSIVYRDSVAKMIVKRLPVTFYLGLIALVISTLISIPAGIISAVRRGSFLDSVITVSANIGMATPIFWLGILGIYFFALRLGWLPVQGYTSPLNNFWLSTRQVIMPSICLGILPLASLTRQTRSSMLEVIRQDYIRTARSKGLKERSVITGHALKNAIIPVITLLGLQVRNLVGGSVLVETVFNIPGMGRLMVTGVFDKDFPVVQGCILVIALVVALANLVVDISYGFFDPRIRNE
ncbi:MAG: ABC transporter permease [Dethiobacter sp.]|jgi:peptide/nickel transport system permease protein|nr:MAG: ABC transporter permease [Dethiobacter sp.]